MLRRNICTNTQRCTQLRTQGPLSSVPTSNSFYPGTQQPRLKHRPRNWKKQRRHKNSLQQFNSQQETYHSQSHARMQRPKPPLRPEWIKYHRRLLWQVHLTKKRRNLFQNINPSIRGKSQILCLNTRRWLLQLLLSRYPQYINLRRNTRYQSCNAPQWSRMLQLPSNQ